MSVTAAGASQRTTRTLSSPWIIAASSVDTLVEWYDFYICGVLAVFLAQHFPRVARLLSLRDAGAALPRSDEALKIKF